MTKRRVHEHRSHRGSLLVESSLALMMLVMAMTLTVQILGAAAGGRRASEKRDRAVIEVANLMEQITARPFDQATPELAKTITLSEGSKRSLPGAELKVVVADSAQDAKRIAIRLRWRARSGEWESPVVLVSWIDRKGGRP